VAKAAQTASSATTESLGDVLGDVLRRIRALCEESGNGCLFPQGIDSLRVSLELPTGKVEVVLSGATAATSPPDVAADVAFEPPPGDLQPGQKVPNAAERDTVGAATTRIVRDTPAFAALTRNENPAVVFKNEEGTGADRMMTATLSGRIDALAMLVASEWAGTKLRVTEAWDENQEHGKNSIHYEARAADLTTHPIDSAKLGRLGRLAVDAGFEWVFFETNHIHVSMST
jgi:Hedgehog amino-terminal signalling domain